MSAQVVLLAEAVKQTLLSGEFVLEIAPTRVFDTEEALIDLAELNVAVVPQVSETSRISRNRKQRRMTVLIALRKKLSPDDDLEELTELCDEIEDLFEGHTNVTFPSASCIAVGREPVFSQENLVNLGQFTSQITLTYLDFGDEGIIPGNPGGDLEGADTHLFTAENKDFTQIHAGQPVGIHDSGTGIVRASADVAGKDAVGLAAQGIQVSSLGLVQTEGIMELEDWTNVIGTAYLTPNCDYYLSVTVGLLTRTGPTGTGQKLQLVGHSLTQTKMDLRMEDPIVL